MVRAPPLAAYPPSPPSLPHPHATLPPARLPSSSAAAAPRKCWLATLVPDQPAKPDALMRPKLPCPRPSSRLSACLGVLHFRQGARPGGLPGLAARPAPPGLPPAGAGGQTTPGRSRWGVAGRDQHYVRRTSVRDACMPRCCCSGRLPDDATPPPALVAAGPAGQVAGAGAGAGAGGAARQPAAPAVCTEAELVAELQRRPWGQHQVCQPPA